MGVVLTLVAVVRGLSGAAPASVASGTALWFAVCSVALLVLGVGLVRGRQWARSPAVVGQLLLLGVAWYAAVPSSQPEYGLPAAGVCVLILVLLFSTSTARWMNNGDELDQARKSRGPR